MTPPARTKRAQKLKFSCSKGFVWTLSSNTKSTVRCHPIKSLGLYPGRGMIFEISATLSLNDSNDRTRPACSSSDDIHVSLTHGSMQYTVTLGGAFLARVHDDKPNN